MWPTSLLSLTVLLAALPFPSFAAPYCGLKPPRSNAVSTSGSGQSHPGSGNNNTEDVVAAAWYPGWLKDKYPSSNLSWSKYTHMTFAFAVTADNGSLSLDGPSTQELPIFVQNAKQNNVKALVSLGGWSGSRFFSSNVATDANRTQFVKTVVDFATQNQLDGIDFDWEYPNKQGLGCNVISPQDSANFLSFLQALRTDPQGQKLYLSAAVGITPFAGADGNPMSDVSGFAKVLDHIAIMNYDIWGKWSATVGPNAPLADACMPTQAGSATSAVKAWTAAGFPADQLVLGVASYGHSFSVANADALDASQQLLPYPKFNATNQPLGDGETAADAQVLDQCGKPSGIGGVFDFVALIRNNFLGADGKVASGMEYRYDNCSQTPYVYNPQTQVMIAYDDATSFAAKGHFINDNNLKGYAMWYAVGDSNDILIDSISDAMGIEQDCS